MAVTLDQDAKLLAWRAFSANSAPIAAPVNNYLNSFTVGVKDIIDVEGLPTRCGSAIYEHAAPATVDAACVALMRNAGATIIGKTVTTELATFVPSVTLHPVNAAHTPGGSSAGSAAAVGAGQVRIAIGTQTAGSILRPAAYCGVFGFKPSFDVVPRIGVKVQSETLDTVGVFARGVEDCGAWLSAMTGEQAASVQSTAPLRIAFISNHLEHASADMRDALARAADALKRAGHVVSDYALPSPLASMHEHQRVIQNYESARAYTPERTTHRALLAPALATMLDEGATIPRATYLQSVRIAESARAQADELLREYDVWLMPAAPSAAPLGLASTGDPIFNRLASVVHTPAISVPAYRDAHGMPLGLQLIGARFADAALLANAATIFNVLTKTKP